MILLFLKNGLCLTRREPHVVWAWEVFFGSVPVAAVATADIAAPAVADIGSVFVRDQRVHHH
jgi:hypothetical protein